MTNPSPDLAAVVAAEVAVDNMAITALKDLAAQVAAGTANTGHAQAAVAALEQSQAALRDALQATDPGVLDPPATNSDPSSSSGDPSTTVGSDVSSSGENPAPAGSDVPTQGSA